MRVPIYREKDQQRYRIKTLTVADVHRAIALWPSLYATEEGREFRGMLVSEISKHLIESGWRNVSHLDHTSDMREIGCEVVQAQYINGAHPTGRFVDVIVWQDRPRPVAAKMVDQFVKGDQDVVR